jgi:hypothetical protein
MSSPIPHSSECGMDWTSDSGSGQEESSSGETTKPVSQTDTANTASRKDAAMKPEEIAIYAVRAGLTYPTKDGEELYRIARHVPFARRDAFEYGIEDAVAAYYDQIAQYGEPPEPELDIVEKYLSSGLVSGEALYTAYQRACIDEKGDLFSAEIRKRSDKAADLLQSWIAGWKAGGIVHVPKYFGK